MKRRHFLKETIASGTFIGLGGLSLSSCLGPTEKTITILHTNDVHSHIEPFGAGHSKFPNLGGVARRATLIEQIRAENPNTLVFDAGDIFQGTPYFNYFGGELEFKMMSKLGYKAATIGNHDFDNGIEGLEKQLPHAGFDFLTANYDFKNTVMDGKTKAYKIYTIDGIKIGVFGLGIKLDGLVDPVLFKETSYLDPVEITQDMGTLLKEDKGCDLVICLSHLGYYYKKNPDQISDLNLAKRTKNVDLIIGGHTHTFLKKPTIVKNLEQENMLVNQVGCWGVNLGRIDFIFDDLKRIGAKGKSIIV
jgi:5'-nucleotidase